MAVEVGGRPGLAVVEADLDGPDAVEVPVRVASESEVLAGDLDAVLEVGKARVGPALASVRPTPRFPVAEVGVVQEFDARHPLGLLHPELARNENPNRIAVGVRQVLAVHQVGQEVLFAPDALERMSRKSTRLN